MQTSNRSKSEIPVKYLRRGVARFAWESDGIAHAGVGAVRSTAENCKPSGPDQFWRQDEQTNLAGRLAVLVSFGINVSAQTYQSHIEHPIVRYQMSARFDPATKKVAGHYHLTWWNHTEDSIPDLYFHLYLNAFKNIDSTFLREASHQPAARSAEGMESRAGRTEVGMGGRQQTSDRGRRRPDAGDHLRASRR